VLRDLPELHNAIAGLFLLLVIRRAPQGVWGLVTGRWAQRRGLRESADG
jgi:hypothetical protein